MDAGVASKLSFLHPRDPSVDRRFRPRPERQVNLCNLLENDEDDDGVVMQDESSGQTCETEAALVFLRVRPVPPNKYCPFYKVQGKEFVTQQPEGAGKNVFERRFSFNDIFDESVDQTTIYNNCVRNKIETEEDMTVLAYGTSGSGKTFTLLGDLINPGIIPRSLENLFKMYHNNIYPQPSVKLANGILSFLDDECMRSEECLRNRILSKTSDVAQLYTVLEKRIDNEHNFEVKDIANKSVFIWISFAEIYNEIVFDLLNPEILTGNYKKKGLKVMLNQDKVFVKNLTSVYVKTSLEAYKLLTYGLKQVTYASTAINANSSRSHCIFFVDVITFSYPDVFTQKSYKFCDLAGSERLAKTKNIGNRLKEAQRINSSLMVLGRCLDAAYNNQQKRVAELIPFRESKLTFLLKPALTGKEKMTMIVNITPTEQYYEENLNVLGFASMAKSIVYKSPEKPARTRYSWFTSHTSHTISTSNRTVMNDQSSQALEELEYENKELRTKLEQARQEILNLKNQLYKQEMELKTHLVDNFQKMQQTQNSLWEKRLAQTESSLIKVYEAKMNSLEVHYKRKIEELKRYYEEESSDSDSSINEENVSESINVSDEELNDIQSEET